MNYDDLGLKLYYGDLHNHCDLSYGHGSLEEAFRNARLQLDFCSVTVHGAWPDLPTDDPELQYLVDYHQEGFIAARNNWASYLTMVESQNQEGRFVCFPSFEWHSMQDGDHCIYYKDSGQARIFSERDVTTLRQKLALIPGDKMLIPHHIGYKQGFRGINWQSFDSSLSPVAEIFSFHGLSESSEGSYPYLHSMGPCHELSTAQYGWAQGHIFGIVGSTDHHNAFPGSYGYGRMAVWAENLSREAIWQAIAKRRTYALTGDRIALDFRLNGQLMGDICPPAVERDISIEAQAGSSIDYIDIVHNNRIVHRQSVFPVAVSSHRQRYKVALEVGWGERSEETVWNIELAVTNGDLLSLEPRLRGYGPTDDPQTDSFAYHDLEKSDNKLTFKTRTRANQSLHTATTEGLSLELEASASTLFQITLNGQDLELPFAELLSGSRTFYLGGFVSPCLCVHRAIPEAEYQLKVEFSHQVTSQRRDWYYLRLRQRNNQWAWTSPIWVNPS